MRLLSRVVALSLAGLATVAQAHVLDRRPMPQVELGGHSSYIKKLSVDRAGRLVLTVSDDKTARLWHAASGQLLRIFRVPIESGHEGQLYAAALTPDGRIAVVAGFTGFFEQGRSSVYFFDTASGHMVLRLLHLSDAAVENLTFSPDGSVLAVCLGDGRGVRIFDWHRGAALHSETNMRDKILGAAFSSNRDLAVTTLDGSLWMFRAAANYEGTAVQLAGGRRPMHLQFSPDNVELVVGFDGDPTFSIVDARLLKEIYVGRISDSAGQRGLHIVEWSSDGEYVYAGGETVPGVASPIYRFAQKGRASAQRFLLSTRRISDIRRLPDGAVAFASGEPEVGVIESSGRVRWRYRSATLDLRPAVTQMRVSAAADSVNVSGPRGGFLFDMKRSPESVLTLTDSVAQSESVAMTQKPAWQLVVSEDQEQLTVNRHAAALDHREAVQTWLLDSRADHLIVGTSWSLRAFDKQAQSVWDTPLNTAVNSILMSADRQVVVSALADGTIRWYRASDGQEFMALLVSRNREDWIAWIPTGYYMSSTAGDKFMGWHVNREPDREPDFYRATQFERILYRPDLVRAYFASRGKSEAAGQRAAPATFDIANLENIAPPRLGVMAAEKGQGGQTVMTVTVTGESHSLPLNEWSLYLNGIPIVAGAALGESEKKSFSREMRVRMKRGLNQLRAESFNGQSLGVSESVVEAEKGSAGAPGVLYVAAIGTGDFQDHAIQALRFASNDATEIAHLFESLGKNSGFSTTKTLLLADTAPQKATRANVLARLGSFLSAATGDDTVVVFLASHGLSDSHGNYYFVPQDARFADIKGVLGGLDRAPSLLRWDYFVDRLRDTAGRRLLIVDTCSSGNAAGTFDVHSLAKRSMASSFALMAASRGSEESQELPAQEHGLFTYGLLEALRTGYDPDHDGTVSLSEAFEFAYDNVQKLKNKAAGAQTPQLSAPDVLADMVLARAGAAPTLAFARRGGPRVSQSQRIQNGPSVVMSRR